MRLVLSSLFFALAGLLAVPPLVFFLGLALAYAFDPRCGTPGDSGGCEMGLASIAAASAIPGALAGIATALVRHFRRQRS